MVFWKTYPIINWIQSFFNSNSFQSQIFNKKQIYLSPSEFSHKILTQDIISSYELYEIHIFLKEYFGNSGFAKGPNSRIV